MHHRPIGTDDQGHFLDFLKVAFENQTDLSNEILHRYATDVGRTIEELARVIDRHLNNGG